MNSRTETLLLAAHGSSRPGGENPVLVLAKCLKAQGLFADVRCGFLKQAPLLADVLADIKTPDLVVVPMLSGNGYITDTLIPDALAAISETVNVRLCEPLGCHADIARLMADRALSVIAEHKLDRQQVSILLCAHGNANNPQNARQTKALAANIAILTGGLQTNAAFIEEEPLISSWPSMTNAEHLIVLPFLIGGGLHGAEDIPVMLGLDAHIEKFSDNAPFIGPLSTHDAQVWCCRALGFEPAISDLILDLASET